MSLRWGILSTGRISNDFVNALKTLPANDHQVVAVAARSLTDAQEFAKQHNIAKAYEGYDSLAEDKTINIVYVGVINTGHLSAVKQMLAAGKHVLCEKPLGMNAREVREMIACAAQAKRYLMEAIWSRCFPVYRELRRLLDEDTIGKVMNVHVAFGFPLEHVDRVNVKEMGGGTILDLGVYTLQLLQFVYRGISPVRIVADGHLNAYQTDESANAIFIYPDGRTGVMSTSARVMLPNEAVIIGTKGTIRIPEFWSPSKITTPDGTKEFPLPESTAKYNFGNSQGLAYEAEEARRCINLGLLESPDLPHAESQELGEHMDTLRKAVGVVYAQDL